MLLSRDARRTLLGLALFGAVLGTCAACNDSRAPSDGGDGEAGLDAGRDAPVARDAGRDGGPDASMNDAGDPSIDIEPGWVKLEGFARQCPNERATNPAPLLDVRWEPCPFDTDDCMYLAWDERCDKRTFRRGTSDHGGNRGYFVMTGVRDQGPGAVVINVVADTAGETYAAWRTLSDPRTGFACGGITAVGGGRVVHLASSRGPRPGTELLYGPHRLYWSDLESASEGEHLALVMGESIVPPGNTAYWIRTSESLVALVFDGTTQVLLFDGEQTVLHGGLAGPYGLAVAPHVVGSDAFWTAHVDGTRRLMTASITSGPTALYEDELMQVDAAGTDLVWQRIVERPLCQRGVRQLPLDISVPMGGEWCPPYAQVIPSPWSCEQPRSRAPAA